MTYKVGDKVRIKKHREHEIRKEALGDIARCGGVFTIHKVIEGGSKYIAEELSYSWKFKHYYLELVDIVPLVGPMPESINSRFEILDL